jgi:hypothetical protein
MLCLDFRHLAIVGPGDSAWLGCEEQNQDCVGSKCD